MQFINELRRRNVHRIALAYLAGSWLLIQVAATVFPAYGLPAAALTVLITVLAIGFVPAVILSWVFDWTPDGVRRDTNVSDAAIIAPTNKRLDRAIIITLVLAVGYFAIDKFVIDPSRDAEKIQTAREEGRADALVESFGDLSILVLPFVNMSADPEQEYFSDGISEELLNLLAKIPELRVISRSTAFTFKGKDIVISEVAKKLNVAHILEGSVRRSGNKVRITAQLIDARTDTHLWSETYDRELDDIFAIQDEISAKVVADLKLKLLGNAPKAEEIDPKAYDLYLQARYILHAGEEEQEPRAVTLLEKVVELDPDWTRGIHELMRAYQRLHSRGEGDSAYYEEKTLALLDRLFEIDPEGAYAILWRGWLAWQWNNDVQQAAVDLALASHKDPYDLDIQRPIANFLGHLGRYDEANAVLDYIIERDPACGLCISMMATNMRQSGHYREAAVKLESILDWHPPSTAVLWPLGVVWLMAGEPEKALGAFDRLDRSGTANLGRLLALHDLGRTQEFEEEFVEFREGDAGNPEGIARVYAWMGKNDEAFLWLDRMVELQGPESVELIRTELYSKLHSDPRWTALQKKYAKPAEDLSHIVFKPAHPPEVAAAIARITSAR
jgi:adenylate cyclase